MNRSQEARDHASKMFGNLLITKQTGKEGKMCNQVMITSRKFPRKEYYMAVMMERSFGVRDSHEIVKKKTNSVRKDIQQL